MIEKTNWSVGVLIEHEREQALIEFNGQLPGNRTEDELLALHVRMIKQTVVHRPGGRVAIHTEVYGRRKDSDVQRWQEWIPIPGGDDPEYS